MTQRRFCPPKPGVRPPMPAPTNKAWLGAIVALVKPRRLALTWPAGFLDAARKAHSEVVAALKTGSRTASRLASCACFLLALYPSPAAAWNSAGNLDGYCKALVTELDKGGTISEYANNCVSYFEGVGDALLRAGQPGQSKCLSDHYLNLDDLRNARIFVDYMDKHPEKHDDIASDVIRQSLEEFCKQ